MSRPVIRKARIKDTDRIIKLLSELGIPGPKKEEEIKHFAHIYQKILVNCSLI
jgi:N-acetylglutamate synthase-like GNAT family acetyltransferase